MGQIIDCKLIKEKYVDKLIKKVKPLKDRPRLAVVKVLGDAASDTYVRNKIALCEKVGIECRLYEEPGNITYKELMETIINASQWADGCILQLPLPKHLKGHEQRLIDLIPHEKDVDCLTTMNIGLLHSGNALYYPPTAQACIDIMDEVGYKLEGGAAMVIGRSNLLGVPLSRMLTDRNVTVMLAHSKTSDYYIDMMDGEFDIVVSAVGIPKQWKDIGAKFVLDVGINRDEDGKLCGDIDLARCQYEYATSVGGGIGGIGQLTCVNLIKNTLRAYELSSGVNV
ncbi:MAG: tetrahydrofolate dehydrogenase/cyclohydrolase catalytic domain-containing protein [Cellulosilyticaceae bacterium]